MTNMRKVNPMGIREEIGLENNWHSVSIAQLAPKKNPA